MDGQVRPMIPAKPSAGEVLKLPEVGGRDRLVLYSPDLQKMDCVREMMKARGALSRISKEQIVLEGLVDAAGKLGMSLPGTNQLILTCRELSCGLDGLGRSEVVTVLTSPSHANYYPSSAFPQESGPGFWSRLLGMVTGKGGDK